MYANMFSNMPSISAIFRVLFFILCLMGLATISAQPPQFSRQRDSGRPHIRNYDFGQLQFFDLAQDDRGMLYFAGGYNIREFDGYTFRDLIEQPLVITALAVGGDGRVYVGAKGEIGYLQQNASGRPQFISLLEQFGLQKGGFSDVLKILPLREALYFQTPEMLGRWSAGGVRLWRAKNTFVRAFAVADTVYVQEHKIGLRRLSEDSLQLVSSDSRLADYLLAEMLAFPRQTSSFKKEILLATRKQGLLRLAGNTVAPFETSANAFFIKHEITCGAAMPNNAFVFGTRTGGVIILDSRGEILQHLDKASGLTSNLIRAVHPDRRNGLWVAPDRGFAFVDAPSPFSIFDEAEGIEGSVYAMMRHNGILYASTAIGVSYLRHPATGQNDLSGRPKFRAVAGISGTGRTLISTGPQLFALASDGLYEILGDQAKLIMPPPPLAQFRLMHRSQKNPQRFFIGMYDGVLAVRMNKNGWIYEGRINGVQESIREIVESEDGKLWLGTRESAIVCLDFGANTDSTRWLDPRVTRFELSPEESDDRIRLFAGASHPVIATDTQLLRHDEKSQRFVPDSTFGLQFVEGTTGARRIEEDEQGNLWIGVANGGLGVARRQADHSYQWQRLIFPQSQNTLVNSIYPETGAYAGIVWFGSRDHLIRYEAPLDTRQAQNFPALIRRVLAKDDSVLFDGIGGVREESPRRPKLQYQFNALRFEVAGLSFESVAENRFSFFLEGFDKGWSSWTPDMRKDYTNLPEGDYNFRARARNIHDEESSEAVFAFAIAPPWYRTWWAYTIYVLLVSTFLYGIRRYELNRMRLKNQVRLEQMETEKLKELDAVKSRFFANISHEFRTPLTLILGPLKNLQATANRDGVDEQYSLMERNAQRLLRLINQLLDLSKLEAGAMELQASCANLIAFLKGALFSFESLAAEKRIALQFQSDYEDLPVYFEAEKLEQVFYNLISNAIKFTPENSQGKIIVTVTRSQISLLKKLTPNTECVQITVDDNGIGISAEKLPRIFDRFYTSTSSVRAQEGTGIGLALAKEIVELHYGEIEAKSEEGGGTAFTVTLPLGKAHLKASELSSVGSRQLPVARGRLIMDNELRSDDEQQTTDNEQLTTSDHLSSSDEEVILIVEDNREMRAFIRAHLQNGYRVIEAADGEEGVAAALESIPDLIISDVMMPKRDGNELCQILKNDEKTSHIPIILLTAKAARESKLEGLETGADDYLTKPFDAKELRVRVKNLIEQRRMLRERFSRELVLKPGEIAITSLDEQFLNRVKAVVEKHLGEEEFSVEELAREAGMSRVQLHRKLKALTNQAAGEFILSMRLQRALELMQKNAGTIAEIAYMTGFNTPSYFTKCFRKQFGCAPTEWREKPAISHQ